MPTVSFCKIIPGGNSTILLPQPTFAPDKLAHIARALMHPMHLQAEQVGALYLKNPTAHLQMMGGEFCVNATRAAALLLEREGRLTPCGPGCSRGELTVSGMATPIAVITAEREEDILSLLKKEEAPAPQVRINKPTHRFCGARIPCGAGCLKIVEVEAGITLIHLPGISHLLIDATEHPMPENWRKAASAWRRKTGLDTAPASGIIWYDNTSGFHIWPAVEVQATHTEHMETACGSASLALALMVYHTAITEAHESGTPGKAAIGPIAIRQPSGEALTVALEITATGSLPDFAWVFGAVWMAGEGTAYFEEPHQ